MSEPWWRDAVPARPIRVTGGIQINSTRGAVARTMREVTEVMRARESALARDTLDAAGAIR